MRKRVLLGHLNSNGDCLFATVIARQIKEVDYPDCHLTWAVNSKCKQSVELNPYVDAIWEIPTKHALTSEEEWDSFVSEVEKKKKDGEFDFVFFTQIFGDNWLNYDGGIRSSTYNNYPHKITVPFQPIIQLSDAEINSVRKFAEMHQLGAYKQVILVECGADSFDTALNPQSAYELALNITLDDKQVAIVLSSNKEITSAHSSIIDGSKLTFRENAELTKYCDMFVGCASGISWLTTTTWAKKLNTILVINQDKPPFPSMIYDHEYLSLPTDHIIEMKSNKDTIGRLRDCLNKISVDGFADARKTFNERITLNDYFFLDNQMRITLSRFEFGRLFSSLRRSIRRNGIQLVFTTQFGRVIGKLMLISINKLLRVLGLRRKSELIGQNK